MADGTLPQGEPKYTLAWHLADWAYRNELTQPDGEHAGDPWVWAPDQFQFMQWFYAVDEDLAEIGQFRLTYRRAGIRKAKGKGKSPGLAAISVGELCGPVIPDFIGECTDDECSCHDIPEFRLHGKPHPMPWVQLAATAEDQTVNTNSMISAMLQKDSKIVSEYNLDVGKTITYKPGGGRLQVITSSPSAAEGARPTFVVMDEVQEWYAANGGHALANVIRRNLAKTGGRSVEAGNAHAPGRESVSERTLAAWQAQQEGRTRGGGILYDCVEAPPDTDLTDEKSLRAALEIVYEGSPWVDIDRIIGEIWDPDTTPDVSRRYYLNQVTAAEDAWATPQDVKSLISKQEVAEDTAVALFFDGSKSGDATGIVGCEIESGHCFVVECWEPSGKGWEVPVEAVDGALERAMEKYDVVAFFADVKEWEQSTKVTWPTQFADRLLVHAVPGGKDPQAIAWDMRSHVYDFTMACELVEAEIREHGFTIDGDPRLSRHMINAHRRPNRYGVSISKETRTSEKKIDLAVCLVGARMARRLVLASPKWQKRRKRKTRGRAIVMN